MFLLYESWSQVQERAEMQRLLDRGQLFLRQAYKHAKASPGADLYEIVIMDMGVLAKVLRMTIVSLLRLF